MTPKSWEFRRNPPISFRYRMIFHRKKHLETAGTTPPVTCTEEQPKTILTESTSTWEAIPELSGANSAGCRSRDPQAARNGWFFQSEFGVPLGNGYGWWLFGGPFGNFLDPPLNALMFQHAMFDSRRVSPHGWEAFWKLDSKPTRWDKMGNDLTRKKKSGWIATTRWLGTYFCWEGSPTEVLYSARWPPA